MYEVIFWDFDGVILNSNDIRTSGFAEVLESYPKDKVDKLIAYHIANGGLSRYDKIKYFFEEILQIKPSKEEVNILCNNFSQVVYPKLTNRELLIKQTMDFIVSNSEQYMMFIVSGSDKVELGRLCKFLQIDKYFSEIEGSPTPKTTLVRQLILKYDCNPRKCILVGDSINDFKAARDNNIDFMGVGDKQLLSYSDFLLF